MNSPYVIQQEKVTTKPQFDNSNCKFYHELIPKAAKMKTTIQRQQKLKMLPGEFWACDVIKKSLFHLKKQQEDKKKHVYLNIDLMILRMYMHGRIWPNLR